MDGEQRRGDEPPRRGFLSRVLLTFTAPGALGDSLRAHPAWFAAAVLGAVILVGATAAIPAEVWSEFMRAQTLARGGTVQEGAGNAELFRIIGIASAGLAWFVILFAFSGVLTFIFAFVLGDEGRYRQYLSALAHANIIGAVGALVVTPLRIARRDPQLTLSVGTFVEGFLGDGFLLFWLRGLDLFAIWSWVVLAILVSRIDIRRSTGSSVSILLGLLLILMSVVAWFQARALA
ncbi:MAG TPA: YIP1 family protein [Longimicrobiales bacterium]|nr:YIP1 family protein [Longimicrobiales bacterium]